MLENIASIGVSLLKAEWVEFGNCHILFLLFLDVVTLCVFLMTISTYIKTNAAVCCLEWATPLYSISYSNSLSNSRRKKKPDSDTIIKDQKRKVRPISERGKKKFS